MGSTVLANAIQAMVDYSSNRAVEKYSIDYIRTEVWSALLNGMLDSSSSSSSSAELTLYVVWQSCLTTMLGMFVFMLYKFKDKVKKDRLEEGRTEADS